MKKRILSLLLAVVLLFAVVPFSAGAASYPLIYLDTWESSLTIPKGEVGTLSFTIFPEFKNEEYTVLIYDEDGYQVASASSTYYNSSTMYRTVTITVNTNELDLDVGKYKIEYYLRFYSLYQWNEAPRHYTGSFEVIKNVCKGKHTMKRVKVVDEPTCEDEGTDYAECSKCDYKAYRTMDKAHDFGSATVTKKPTPTASGKQKYTCKTCGTTKTETIPTSKAVKIKTQPKTAYAQTGKTAKVTVAATGEGLKYEWYVRDADSTKYTKSSITKATYSATMSSKVNGRRVYCIVKDKWGNSVKTNTVLVRAAATITKQPASVSAYSGKTVKVTVKASGEGLKYQWYLKDKGATSFKKSSTTSSTYSCKLSSSNDGRQVYCKVTDKYGNSVKSKTVTLDTRFKVKLTKKPTTTYAKSGATAKVTVKATGDGLKYTWFVKEKGASKYSKVSCTSATYSYKMSKTTSGRRVYCKITDKYGNWVNTDPVSVLLKK